MTEYEEVAHWIYYETNQPIDEIEAHLKDIPKERFEKLYSSIYDGTPEQQINRDINYIKEQIARMNATQQTQIIEYLKSWVL